MKILGNTIVFQFSIKDGILTKSSALEDHLTISMDITLDEITTLKFTY